MLTKWDSSQAMKKLFVVAFVSFFITQVANGQTINLPATKSSQPTYDSYINRYRTNRTIGRVLLGSGIGMIIGGGIAFASYAHKGYNGPAPVTGEALLFIVGPAAALVSIPFFISAKRNKTKAALVMKSESVTLDNKITYQSNYAALALTIQF